MANAETARLIAQLILDDKQFQAALNRSNKSLSKLDKGFGRAGKGVGQLGKGLFRLGAVGAGAAAVGIAGAGKAAIDFEDAFAGVRKTVDATDLAKAGLSFEAIKKQFLDLSTQIPVTASDLARIGETAGALGIKAQDITKFTEVVAKLGATTNLTTDQAAEDLGKIGTILGLTGKQYEGFGDILVNLGNKGASTETEIIEVTKRFAAAGKSAGLSTPQILAFASAISSAGVEPEAAGGALSRLFGKLVQETALGTKKSKEFAKVSGKSFKDWSKLVEEDTSGAMLVFLKNLGELDKFDQAKALKAVGITNTRDINAIRLLAQTYDKNLVPALKNAQDSAGALDKESAIRFDTIRSKFQLLKNAFVKGGIEMGDGFLPALGRLTTKVTNWVNTNSGKLQQVGRDIGKALDDIDWNEVERGAKKVGDAAKVILDVIKQIPTEVKLGGLAFIGLDKASGGLLSGGLGNVAGGAGDILMKQFLARGSSPANPLWVQSIGGGVGGPGGAAGGKGGPGILGLLGLAGLAVTIAGAVEEGVKGANSATGSNFSGPSAPFWISFPNNVANAIVLGIKTLKPDFFTQPKPNITGPSDRQHEGAGFRPNPAAPTAFFKPDKVDAQKNTAKITAATNRTTTAVETMRGNLGGLVNAGAAKTATSIESTKAKLGGTLNSNAAKIAATTRAGAIGVAVAAKNAGGRAAAAGDRAALAIRRKRLSTSVTVNARTVVNLSGREWLAQATQTNIRGGAS